MRAFRHRDFRLLWIGAFVSFTGSWIQNTGERWLVQELTHNTFLLTTIFFCGSAPVAVLGPFAGTLADEFDKKFVLNIAQILFALGALALAVLCFFRIEQFWELAAIALLFGIVGAFEGPTRQSVVSRVVPPEDLARAVPLNAMTFNVARLIGPAIAMAVLEVFDHIWDFHIGAGVCYALNGISYIALIFAVLAIKSNLKPTEGGLLPVGDLIVEGMIYTWRDVRFRTLFLMEVIASACGMFYIAAMPSFTTEIMHLDERGLGLAYTLVGLGAILGLLLMVTWADRPIKARMVRYGMYLMGIGIFLLGFVRSPFLVYPLLPVIGASVMVQFNTTNTIFQLLSPDRLRGRVLAMHQWAVGGLGPFGTLLFGWFAQTTKRPQNFTVLQMHIHMPIGGLPLTLNIGGACILLGALWGSWRIKSLQPEQWEIVNQSS